MRSKLAALALAGALSSAGALHALGPITAVQFDLGIVTDLNLDPATSAGSSSLITNILGFGLTLPFRPGSRWSFEPTADFYWANFGLVAGKAVPVDIGDRDAFVVGAILDAPVFYTFDMRPPWKLSLGAGLAINARYGFIAVSGVSSSTVDAINGYFWSGGRFIMPSTLARAVYNLTRHIDFGFTALAYWPIFNLWAGTGLSFFDQGIFGGSLVVRYIY
ncbi:MAG TPA: hypothetical protein VMV90_05200 [Rectinemataceae bacterium]|nr:hypothetical protein [Rectinemataceae bacterium]